MPRFVSRCSSILIGGLRHITKLSNHPTIFLESFTMYQINNFEHSGTVSWD